MRHRRWRLGGCYDFVGGGGDFPVNRSQVRRPWCAVCVYRRRPASMPDHGGSDAMIFSVRAQ